MSFSCASVSVVDVPNGSPLLLLAFLLPPPPPPRFLEDVLDFFFTHGDIVCCAMLDK